MTYVFDIDGTICSKTDGDYTQAQPFPERIQKVNDLYDEGHTIIFLTARGMGRSSNSVNFAYESFYDLTYSQLLQHKRLNLSPKVGDLRSGLSITKNIVASFYIL